MILGGWRAPEREVFWSDGCRYSDRGAVAEVHDTVAEPALVQQLELGARVAGQRGLASTEEYGPDEQVALIDESGFERVGGEVRTAHGEITGGRCLRGADRVGVEVALEPSFGGRHSLQRGGVDDLVGRPPDVREVGHELRLAGQARGRLPRGHRLVHAPTVKVGAGGGP